MPLSRDPYIRELKAATAMTAQWRREVEMRKLEELERKLELEECLRKVELNLFSASQQVRISTARLIEKRTEMTNLEHGELLARIIKISEADVDDLASELSNSFFSVLDSLRMARSDSSLPKDQLKGEEKRSNLVVDMHNECNSPKCRNSGAIHKELDDRSAGSNVVGSHHTAVSWVRVQWSKPPSCDRVQHDVTVRLHDVYTFQDLKNDICSHLQLRGGLPLVEICSANLMTSWPDAAIVMAEIRKGELSRSEVDAQVDQAPVVRLRCIPPMVKMTHMLGQEQTEEHELQHDIAQKAEAARRSAHYVRSVVLSRKPMRRARSLVLRGLLHTAFAVIFTISTSQGNSRGYHTISAVRSALTARFSTEPEWMSALACAQGKDATTHLKVGSGHVRQATRTLQYGLALREVDTVHGVHAWLRGALVDALVPRCSYDFLPPTLQIELSARQMALSCLEMRSERIELMMSRSSSSPSRSMSAHQA